MDLKKDFFIRRAGGQSNSVVFTKYRIFSRFSKILLQVSVTVSALQRDFNNIKASSNVVYLLNSLKAFNRNAACLLSPTERNNVFGSPASLLL
jgi:hypothetical protein